MRVRSVPNSLLAICLALALPRARAAAQAAPPAADAARELPPGRTVRIAVAGAGRFSGRLLAVGPDSLQLHTAGAAPRTVALGAIDSLWVRQRRTKEGLLVGTAVGVAVGVALGLALDKAVCEGASGCRSARSPILLGLTLGAGGAGAGALVGATIVRWRLRAP